MAPDVRSPALEVALPTSKTLIWGPLPVCAVVEPTTTICAMALAAGNMDCSFETAVSVFWLVATVKMHCRENTGGEMPQQAMLAPVRFEAAPQSADFRMAGLMTPAMPVMEYPIE